MPAIDLIGNAYAYLKDADRQTKAEQQIERKQKLERIQQEFDMLVVRAVNQEGSSIASVANEMGASRNTVYEILKRGRAIASALPINDPLAQRYSVDGEKIRVTLTEAEVMDLASDFGFTADTVRANAGHLSALFTFTGGDWYPEEISGLFVGGMRHPVSYWFDVESNRQELREWAKGVGV